MTLLSRAALACALALSLAGCGTTPISLFDNPKFAAACAQERATYADYQAAVLTGLLKPIKTIEKVHLAAALLCAKAPADPVAAAAKVETATETIEVVVPN